MQLVHFFISFLLGYIHTSTLFYSTFLNDSYLCLCFFLFLFFVFFRGVGVVCNLVISVDVRPKFTGIAL